MIYLINNRFVSEKNAKIPLNSSLLRGYGIFETIRTYGDSKLFRPEDHMDRLFSSAKKIDLKIKYSKKEILKMLRKIIKKSTHKNQRIKIVALPEKLIITSNQQRDNKKIYDGVKCISLICERSLPDVKSISYLPSFLSHETAVKKGYFEAILTDESGEVYEGAYSNIFWFEGDTLCTRKDKILPGITRKAILKISKFKTKFKNINIKELRKADEVFLTTSVRAIVPIIKIDKSKISKGKPGPKTKELMTTLSNYINAQKK